MRTHWYSQSHRGKNTIIVLASSFGVLAASLALRTLVQNNLEINDNSFRRTEQV